MSKARLRWNGSNAAMREHEEALRAHPPTPKQRRRKAKQPKKRKGKQRGMQPDRNLRFLPYREYLLTDWWKWRRKQRIKQAGSQCQRCGDKRKFQLRVHHKNYDSLGAERDRDLEVLCIACHSKEHEGWIAANEHLRSIAQE